MDSQSNVNVKMNEVNNVNVNVIKNPTERRSVVYIMRKLGPLSLKDFAYWRKVAQTLSEAQIAEGIDIAKSKKPDGQSQIRYVSGIYRNMMAMSR